MKIKISYEDWERKRVAIVVAALRRVLPGIKVREIDRNASFKHIYLTTTKPEKPSGSSTNG